MGGPHGCCQLGKVTEAVERLLFEAVLISQLNLVFKTTMISVELRTRSLHEYTLTAQLTS